MAYAQVEQDLVPRYKTLTPEETTKAALLLDDAALWLRIWVPGLAAAVAAGGDAALAAKLLSVAMVKRAMQAEDRNVAPGAESTYQMAGVFTEQIRYRNPDGNLYLYDRELNDLLSLITGTPNGAASFTAPGL